MSKRFIQPGLAAHRPMIGPRPRQEHRMVPFDAVRQRFVWMALPIFCVLLQFMPAQAQIGRYSDVRSLVGRVQEDLRRAAGMASPRGHNKDFKRVDNAQRHLSQFDRSLSKGKFDNGKLDAAISDVQSVVDHNTLTPQDRDSLNADLRDLRGVRSAR